MQCVPPTKVFPRLAVNKTGALKMTDMKLQDMKLTDELQGMKLQDMKMADQIAGHENARHEIDGPSCRARNCRVVCPTKIRKV